MGPNEVAEQALAAYRAALAERDEAIREAIAERYSMAEIARIVGVSRNQIYNVSRGRRMSPPGRNRGESASPE